MKSAEGEEEKREVLRPLSFLSSLDDF